jgi:NAD(P)-dependent dehydrogenase (short-subunit alcohol dehydrogenase family)
MANSASLPAGLRIFDLTGRVALVTGAGRGLGRAMARALGSAGAGVILASRTSADLDAAADEICASAGSALAVPTDVTEPDQVERLLARGLDRFGKIDILVNNAGINIPKPVLDLSIEEWDRVLDTNLRAYFLVARAVGRQMVEQRYGRIVNITSILAQIAYQNQAAYAASKGAVTQFAKVLAIEWAPYNVTVNCIGPTFFATEYTRPRYDDPRRRAFIETHTPMRRWGEPDELAGAVIFLASDAAAFVTGHTIFVDGGWLAG